MSDKCSCWATCTQVEELQAEIEKLNERLKALQDKVTRDKEGLRTETVYLCRKLLGQES